jgi:hypothetical protein
MEQRPNSVDQQFQGKGPRLRLIYDRVVTAARRFGAVREEPKKTSIHLANRPAFAGIATRKDSLILTLKSADDIRSARIIKDEQASANRWHLDVRLENPDEVDAELILWIRAAYTLAA